MIAVIGNTGTESFNITDVTSTTGVDHVELILVVGPIRITKYCSFQPVLPQPPSGENVKRYQENIINYFNRAKSLDICKKLSYYYSATIPAYVNSLSIKFIPIRQPRPISDFKAWRYKR